ncbi:MAG TPA: ABC transporter substrate-binding protein, partial [bacterium]
LISMLASGYSPIIPAHIDPNELRTKAIGTGPFKLKSYQPDQLIELEKNPDYFVKGRPYLDGITYTVIKDRQARAAALIAGQIDILFPQEAPPQVRDQVKGAVPQMVVHTVAQSAYYNIVVNTTRPPFDNLKIRQAINYAMDRSAFLKTQLGGAVAAGVILPAPYSPWGLSAAELKKLPGWGDPAKDKAQARKLLAEAGYGPNNPLKVKVSTRSTPLYQDMAVWAIAELKEVGIEGTLDVVESSLWFPKLARKDFELGANMTGAGAEDPDANLFENFQCGSPRNYSGYCNTEVDALMEKMSQETDKKKRLVLVHEVDKRVQLEGARAMLGHALDFQMNWPYVKGYVPHHSIYSYGRMQDVWLDK